MRRQNTSDGMHNDPRLFPGTLPTLGLNKYKNTDLNLNHQNPYKVHDQTEKLLVFREREREFSAFNKLEREGLRVYEKNQNSRPSRKGVIREIKNIKASELVPSIQNAKS
jgi:hypothetical protein